LSAGIAIAPLLAETWASVIDVAIAAASDAVAVAASCETVDSALDEPVLDVPQPAVTTAQRDKRMTEVREYF
jgi:hypothetical protein